MQDDFWKLALAKHSAQRISAGCGLAKQGLGPKPAVHLRKIGFGQDSLWLRFHQCGPINHCSNLLLHSWSHGTTLVTAAAAALTIVARSHILYWWDMVADLPGLCRAAARGS